MGECDRGVEGLTEQKGTYHTVQEATVVPASATQLKPGDAILWARMLMVVSRIELNTRIVHAYSLTDKSFLPVQPNHPEGQLQYSNYYKVLQATYVLPCSKCGGCGEIYNKAWSEEDIAGPIRCDSCSGSGQGERQTYPQQPPHLVAPCCEKDSLYAMFVDPESYERHTLLCVQAEIQYLKKHFIQSSVWNSQMTIEQRIQQLQRVIGEK